MKKINLMVILYAFITTMGSSAVAQSGNAVREAWQIDAQTNHIIKTHYSLDASEQIIIAIPKNQLDQVHQPELITAKLYLLEHTDVVDSKSIQIAVVKLSSQSFKLPDENEYAVKYESNHGLRTAVSDLNKKVATFQRVNSSFTAYINRVELGSYLLSGNIYWDKSQKIKTSYTYFNRQGHTFTSTSDRIYLERAPDPRYVKTCLDQQICHEGKAISSN